MKTTLLFQPLLFIYLTPMTTSSTILIVLIVISALSVVIGGIASRREIGFGVALLTSLVLTPITGIILTLKSTKLPHGEYNWQILGTILGLLALGLIALLVYVWHFA